jgi:cytochrome P450
MTKLCELEREHIGSQTKLTEEKTIFDVLTQSGVPSEDRTIERLRDEIQLILTAGIDTTSCVLTAIVCYLRTYPEILSKL